MVPSTAHVAPVNNTFQSVISQVDVSLNDVSISSSTTTYTYRAYIENHLNYGSDAKESRLNAGLYYVGSNLQVSDPVLEEDDDGINVGLQYRHTICTGKAFDMIGGIHAYFFNQNSYMTNGVILKMRMSRSTDKLVLMGTDNVEYMVEILSAKLLMRKLKIAPSLALAQEKNYDKKPPNIQ